MPTVFRFAAQTADHRFSEIWSFFCNDGRGDIYATRTSMSRWLKASFHESGACHIKSKQKESDPTSWVRDFEWKSERATSQNPSHLLRLIYPLTMQRAVFQTAKRVGLRFEDWPHQSQGALNLNMLIAVDGKPLNPSWGETVATHNLGNNKQLHFVVDVDQSKHELPEATSGMTIHFGEVVRDQDILLGFRNATAVWYTPPAGPGPLTITEGSWDFLDMKDFEAFH